VTTPVTTQVASRFVTPEEYLAQERAAEYKSEYREGEVIPMTGASRRHNLITGNIYAGLHAQFRQKSGEVYQSDMRVKISESGRYVYPDVVVVQDAPLLEDAELDTLLNPTVIFEVLSESTERYDRGEKFEHYRTLDSLSDYVLVAQDRIHVEHFARQLDHSWLYTEYKSPADTVPIPSIDCTLSVEEIYAKVELDHPGENYVDRGSDR
jgi:Uma2 family endonuclease